VTLLGCLVSAWLGAVVGMVVVAVVIGGGRQDRCPAPCCRAQRAPRHRGLDSFPVPPPVPYRGPASRPPADSDFDD
jgi:hypothetical protein